MYPVQCYLQAHVAIKAAVGTNIDPEEKLFSNLISLDAPLQDSYSVTDYRKTKRPAAKVIFLLVSSLGRP